MTNQPQISAFVPATTRSSQGWTVDKHSIAVSFCNQEGSLPALRNNSVMKLEPLDNK